LSRHEYWKTAFGHEIYTSAWDIGNIAAAKNSILWRDARVAFDVYQGGREGISTQNAEYYGWSQGNYSAIPDIYSAYQFIKP